MTYHRRASPLHAARAIVGGAFCLALATSALLVDHPLVLAGLGFGAVASCAGARVGREVARMARPALVMMALIVVINALVSRDGLTVIARLGAFPAVGRIDITLEAVVWGGVWALRAGVVSVAVSLAAAAVDPDEVLRLFRRVSAGSALTAALGTRMLTVLAGDARRLSDAQRTRPDRTASSGWRAGRGLARRAALVRAIATGALERSLNVAATLELRGYSAARHVSARGDGPGRAWSRHDRAFAAAGAGLIALAVAARLGGLGSYDPYRSLALSLSTATLVLAGAATLICLLPFADRRGIEP